MKRRTFIRWTGLSGLPALLPGWMVMPANGPGEAEANPQGYLKIVPDSSGTGFDFFSIDSLGKGKLSNNVVLPQPAGQSGSWSCTTHKKSFSLSSRHQPGPQAPFAFLISQYANHATLLGLMNDGESTVSLPAILHFPDMGTLRISCTLPGQQLQYETRRFIEHPYVKICFPSATPASQEIIYHFEVVSIYPQLSVPDSDERYDGLRKNFISIFQLNPLLRILANNAASDACAFTLFKYSEVALQTPPLADGLTAMDLVGMTLDRYLSGQKGYGLLGYDYDKTWDIPASATRCDSLDSYPSLLISACNYMTAVRDPEWLRTHRKTLIAWADKMLATDTDQDGLLEFCLSGNSGSWKGDKTMRPANWWDTIGFGHKDAYSNALAYRALVLLADMYDRYSPDQPEKASGEWQDLAGKYRQKARKLKEKYTDTFYNPSTGVLAGWKSADGELHDYYFTFVNGVAISYELIEPSLANKIMDTLLEKMKAVGYTDFGLGLPGNLIPVKLADYTDLTLEVGGGKRADNLDGFQIYENGGATACFAYFTIHALQKLGRIKEADMILLPMLESMTKGEFQGRCVNGRSKDWKTWKGECWGYEGFLADNYLFLLAALFRPLMLLLLFVVALSTRSSAQVDSSGHSSQRLETSPLSIVSYSVRVRSSDTTVSAHSFIRFYDAHNTLLLEYKSSPLSSLTYTSTGNYTETPPYARYMEIGVGKDTPKGMIYVDTFHIDRNIGAPPVQHAPLCDIDQCLQPFWKGDTVFNETVLLLSQVQTQEAPDPGQGASGRLLFRPDRILSVRSFDLGTTYQPGTDYRISGNRIIRTAGSHMPFRSDTSFDTRHDLAWYDCQSQWVVVSYTHKDAWEGPVPAYKGFRLPMTLKKLKARSPLRILAYGMSITRGLNVSSYDDVPPYMPPYMDLWVHGLKQRFTCPDIALYNAGLPGALVSWGADYASAYIDPLKPDLVVIDFGMNDFWRYTPDQFKTYVAKIIRKVRSANPHTEFILLANMQFDPDYILDSDKYKLFYTGNMRGYRRVLQQMEGPGIACLDMYTISGSLYQRKKAKDCLTNPLHPNDYLARWYAQCLLALMIGK